MERFESILTLQWQETKKMGVFLVTGMISEEKHKKTTTEKQKAEAAPIARMQIENANVPFPRLIQLAASTVSCPDRPMSL
mmetsp:Transcript_40651/g.68011  ORF Transcript_40651/g.68011 Transcript_40651/m.68011 type:complete len:80 (+) Transcript_40651:935-1174(+)